MKKNLKSKSLFSGIFFAMFFLPFFSLNAQCPFGEKYNCLGECGRFIDENQDSFCDNGLIQVEEVKTETQTVVEPIKAKKEKEVSVEKQSDSKQEKVEEKIEENNSKKEEIISKEKKIETKKEKIISKEKKSKKPYRIIAITIAVLIAYLFTFILVKTGKIKKLSHRKIWNVILLLTFLVSCLLGFVLALQINYGFCMEWFRDFLQWHVEFGIAMTIIAFIHIIWHYKYYTSLVSKKK